MSSHLISAVSFRPPFLPVWTNSWKSYKGGQKFVIWKMQFTISFSYAIYYTRPLFMLATTKWTSYLRLSSIASISWSQFQKARGKENQHFFRFPDLILCPPRWAQRTKFTGHHGVHDDVITVFSKEVHNGSHFATESFVFWVVATVVKL